MCVGGWGRGGGGGGGVGGGGGGFSDGYRKQIFMVNTSCFCITDKTFSSSSNMWQIARKSYYYSPFL